MAYLIKQLYEMALVLPTFDVYYCLLTDSLTQSVSIHLYICTTSQFPNKMLFPSRHNGPVYWQFRPVFTSTTKHFTTSLVTSFIFYIVTRALSNSRSHIVFLGDMKRQDEEKGAEAN